MKLEIITWAALIALFGVLVSCASVNNGGFWAAAVGIVFILLAISDFTPTTKSK